jgi:hypothetical protein
MDSNIGIKRRAVPSDSYLLLYLTHFPVPLAAGLEIEMRTDNLIKNAADFCECPRMRLRIKLKRIVHDATIIESEDLETFILGGVCVLADVAVIMIVLHVFEVSCNSNKKRLIKRTTLSSIYFTRLDINSMRF